MKHRTIFYSQPWIALSQMEKEVAMSHALIERGRFAGVPVTDAFAVAAQRESAVIVEVGPVPWPAKLAPVPQPLGSFTPGQKITGPVTVKC